MRSIIITSVLAACCCPTAEARLGRMGRLYIIIIDSVKRAFVITGGVGVLAAKTFPSPSLNSCTSQGAIPLRFAMRTQIRCVKTGRDIVTDEKQYQGKNLQEHGRGSVIVPDEGVFFVLAESRASAC